MRSNRVIFAASILIALAIHALAYLAMERWYEGYAKRLRDEVATEIRRQRQMDEVVTVRLDPAEFDIGQADGRGDAAHPFDQPDEMTAREGPPQAPLSRDPQHNVQLDTPQPNEAVAELVSPPAPPTPPADQPSTPPPPPPVSYAIPQPEAIELAPPPSPPVDVQSVPTPPQPIPVESASADASTPAPPTASPSPAAAAVASGDPLPMAESDSDPFTQENSVIFRAGQVDVRFGRKIKAVRPHIRLAGRWDLPALQYPSVELRIRIDEHGNVRSAEITKSSGSVNIDQPVLVAIYEWWFEPPKDANGNPRPDVFPFTIHFR